MSLLVCSADILMTSTTLRIRLPRSATLVRKNARITSSCFNSPISAIYACTQSFSTLNFGEVLQTTTCQPTFFILM